MIVRDFFHNHESISESFHSLFRKLAMIKKIMISIDTQFKAQAIFFQIISSLKLKNDDCIFKIKNSYNVKQVIRFKNLDFLFFMQFLLRSLKRNNWYFQYRVDERFQKMTHLIFVEKHKVKILKKNSEIMLMNCIYKINKYKLLFFVIIKHISLRTFFYVEFAFVAKKQKKNLSEFWLFWKIISYRLKFSFSRFWWLIEISNWSERFEMFFLTCLIFYAFGM